MSVARAKDFAFATARVRALKSFLLTDQDFDALLQSRDEIEALQRLASLPRYAQHLQRTVANPRLEQVEEALLASYVELFATVSGWVRGRAYKLVDHANRRFGYENLKLVLTSVFVGTSPDEASRFLLPSTTYRREECLAMIQKGSLEAIVALVEEDLRGPLGEAENSAKALGTALPLEYAVDSFYFSGLWTIAQTLESWDRAYASILIGQEVDILNMLAVIRAKRLRIAKERLQELLIPVRYRLREELESALDAQSLQEAVAAFARGRYSRALLRLSSKEAEAPEVEMAFKRYLANESLRVFASFPLHVGLVLAYLALKLSEISDLRSIIVGKSLRRSSELIRNSLLTYGLTF